MPATLHSSYKAFLRPFFMASQQGDLITLYGNRRGKHWDGLRATTTDLGVDAPTAAATATLDSGGAATAGDYVLYYNYLRQDGRESSLSPVLTKTATANQEFNWADVADHADDHQKQLWRSTAGQATTVYLVTTLNDGTTTYVDQLSDATLAANTARPILTSDGFANANRFTPPPTSKRCIVNVHDRFFYGVTTVYREGSVQLTNGSATVTGIGTNFTDDMVDRKFYVEGDTASYTIDAVSETNQTLTLDANYSGTTNKFVDYYAIKETEDDAEKWYFSGLLEPESVIATDNFKIQWDDGDYDTGGFRLGYSFFTTRSRNIYQVNIGANPRRDISVNHIVNRGSVNPHTMTNVEKTMWMLDYKGLHVFTGGASQHLSEAIQDIFRGEHAKYGINWQASDWFFTSHHPREETVRFHVAMGGGYLPKWAICIHYRKEVGWLEYYPWRFGHSCLVDAPSGLECLYGSEGERVYKSAGQLDGPTEGSGTLRGTVTSATLRSITDNVANFPSTGIVNSPLCIVAGKGKGQWRIITSVSTQTLNIKTPWLDQPDTTSKYVIGGVGWKWKSGLFKLPALENDIVRKLRMAVQPVHEEASLDLKVYLNHDTEPRGVTSAFDRSGVTSTGSFESPTEAVVVDLEDADSFSGYREHNIDDRLEDETDGARWAAFELEGFQGEERIVLHELGIDGVRK